MTGLQLSSSISTKLMCIQADLVMQSNTIITRSNEMNDRRHRECVHST